MIEQRLTWLKNRGKRDGIESTSTNPTEENVRPSDMALIWTTTESSLRKETKLGFMREPTAKPRTGILILSKSGLRESQVCYAR